MSAPPLWAVVKFSRGPFHWFQGLKIIGSNPRSAKTEELLGQQGYGDAIRRLVSRLDFGIDDLRLKDRTPQQVEVVKSIFSALGSVDALRPVFENTDQPFNYAHRDIVVLRNGIEFDLERDESAGTIKALALAGPLVEALDLGHVVVIDELDARLHTLLAKQIVELFQDPRTNPHDAQLVFASHDTNLLTRTLLRRDQLWFVEKSRKTQASDLYSLAELRLEDGKGVRNDARFESDYLRGKYGAIPFFGSIEALLGRTLDGEE